MNSIGSGIGIYYDGLTMGTRLPGSGDGNIDLGVEWERLYYTTSMEITLTERIHTSDRGSDYGVKLEEGKEMQSSGRQLK